MVKMKETIQKMVMARETWYMALENVSFDLGLFLKPVAPYL